MKDLCIRIDCVVPEEEKVTRFLDNGLPIFTTNQSKVVDDDQDDEVVDDAVVEAPGGSVGDVRGGEIIDRLQTLFGCGGDVLPDAKIAEASMNYEAALKMQAEAQLVRAFKLSEEEMKKSDLFLANWPSWVEAQRSQQSAITHLQQLQKVLTSIGSSQTVEELLYPPVPAVATGTPSSTNLNTATGTNDQSVNGQSLKNPNQFRPLFKCFDSISTSTQSQEFENISLALMRRLSGVYEVKKDIDMCRTVLAKSAEQQTFFQNILTDLLGNWSIYSLLDPNMTDIASSDEIDLSIKAEIWVEVLTIPNAVWGVDDEVKKGEERIAEKNLARVRDRLIVDEADGDEFDITQATGNEATSLLVSYLDGAEGGNMIAPSGTWPSLPMISPFTTLFAVLKVRPKEETSNNVFEGYPCDLQYTVQVDLKSDLGLWCKQNLHLQVRLRPTLLKKLFHDQVEENTCRCCLQSIDGIDQSKPRIAKSKDTLISPKDPNSMRFDVADKLKEVDDRPEHRKDMAKAIDRVLRRARLTGLHRALFLICQIQSSSYLPKSPTKQGEGSLSSHTASTALVSKSKDSLPVLGLISRRPVSGTKFATGDALVDTSPPPWLYSPSSPNQDKMNSFCQGVLDDIALRAEFNLIRTDLPLVAPMQCSPREASPDLIQNHQDHKVPPPQYILYHSKPVLRSWDSSTTRSCLLLRSGDIVQLSKWISTSLVHLAIHRSLLDLCRRTFVHRVKRHGLNNGTSWRF
eukprot:GHVH01006039.1.p1 GENE.GHVH01006039.1~~GHVH01006039.1.p1  ORF type:complete len:743 (+),score=98.91 GHVH01006039.1:123-2351(+)